MTHPEAILFFARKSLKEKWDNRSDLEDEMYCLQWASLCNFTDLIEDWNYEVNSNKEEQKEKRKYLQG